MAIQVPSQLTSTRKGNSTATEYFMSIKKLTDELTIAGRAMNFDYIITNVLAGLGTEYDSLVTLVSSREDTTLEELYSTVLTSKARINHNNQALALLNALANITTHQHTYNKNGHGCGNFYQNNN